MFCGQTPVPRVVFAVVPGRDGEVTVKAMLVGCDASSGTLRVFLAGEVSARIGEATGSLLFRRSALDLLCRMSEDIVSRAEAPVVSGSSIRSAGRGGTADWLWGVICGTATSLVLFALLRSSTADT